MKLGCLEALTLLAQAVLLGLYFSGQLAGWSWWAVCAPVLAYLSLIVVVYGTILVGLAIGGYAVWRAETKAMKEVDQRFKRMVDQGVKRIQARQRSIGRV